MTKTQFKFHVQGVNLCSKFKRYTNKGKDLSKLSSLTLNFYTHEIIINRDFHSFIRQLRDLPRLKELNVYFHDYHDWSSFSVPDSNLLEVYRTFSSQLKYLSQVTTLKISIDDKFINGCFQALADGIRHLRNLSSFTLDIKFDHSKFSKLSVQKFAFAISRLHKLSHFDLGFSAKNSLDPTWNKILWKGLGRLENLDTLDLKFFPFICLDVNGIKTFFENFRNLKRLSNLKLDFLKVPGMSTEMADALLNGFQCLGKLQIPSSLYDEREREKLRRTSAGHYFGLNLKELTVSFPRAAALTEESIKGFAKFLLSMKRSLRLLSIDFTFLDKFTADEILEFFKHLSNLELLKTLKLRFSGKPLTDYFLKSLAYRCSYLLNLSELELDLQKTNQITSKGLRGLSEALRMVKNLSSLDLRVGLLPKVTDSSIQAFFKNLRNLEVLKLDFSELPQIDEDAMYSLAEGLVGLQNLKELHLDLSHCENFTNEALENLAYAIRNIPRLGKLILHIYDCKSVNEKGIKCLADGLEARGKMSYVWLNINESESISEKFMQEVYMQLKNKISDFFYSKRWFQYLSYNDRKKRKQCSLYS